MQLGLQGTGLLNVGHESGDSIPSAVAPVAAQCNFRVIDYG
tara:strand:- start:168 stop:290 length:123 start_codon:yes stop_codon:yes gene_type:complete